PGDDGRAQPGGAKRGLLRVHGADAGALVIREYRCVDRARQMIVGELRRRAYVDDFVEPGEAIKTTVKHVISNHGQILQCNAKSGKATGTPACVAGVPWPQSGDICIRNGASRDQYFSNGNRLL